MTADIKNPRVRMAPSPTGFFHIGSGRTALFNYLFAKKYGGTFVLRIEDTDTERSKKEFEDDILESMRWLGIDADEDPINGGRYAPYRQSERKEIYKTYLQKLLDTGDAFYCFHSEEELETEKEEFTAAEKPLLHRCRFRGFSNSESKRRAAAGENYIIRFKVPEKSPVPLQPQDTEDIRVADKDKWIEFDDLIRKRTIVPIDIIEDFAIAKDIGTPLYNFAAAIDDYEMKITYVIRGEDHISNTPKQILLQYALGFSQSPRYAHLPLILAPDRSKLSKRHGAVSIREYRDQGYLPEALINFIALLGWNPGTNQEIFSKAELEKEFSIERVQKSGAIFDIVKLDWMNGEYIRKKSLAELVELCKPYLKNFLKFSIPNNQFSTAYFEKVIALEQPRLKKLSEIGERVDFFFQEPEYDKELLHWKNMTDEEVKNALQKAQKLLSVATTNSPIDKKTLEKAFFDEIGDSDKGKLLWPLRVALSGKKASPGPFEIIEIFGIEESIKRLEQAERKFG